MRAKFYLLNTLFLGFVAAVLAGCGTQAFTPGEVVSTVQGPGTFSIPAKVDVLVAQDNTMSILEATPSISAQLPQIIDFLKNSNWDYRLAATPLTHYENPTELRDITQIMASQYDPNWISLGDWKEPFPGADPDTIDKVLSNFFKTPSNFSAFMAPGDVLPFNASQENGFKTIKKVLYDKAPKAQFLRKDALLAVLVVSNGNDTSDVNMCPTMGNNSIWVPCGSPGTSPSSQSQNNQQETFDYYKQQFTNLVANKSTTDLRFYSMVSFKEKYNCLTSGDHAYAGQRYINMAQALGGKSFDLCATPITTALQDLAGSLAAIKINYITDKLTIGYEPDVSKIQVFRLINGDPANKVLIPQSATHGWTYEGGPKDVYTISYPKPMNFQEHVWVLQLHGNAQLHGNDGAQIIAPAKDGTPSS